MGAIVDFKQTLVLNSNNTSAYLFMGSIKILFLGQKESGCLDLKKAEELGNKEASKQIGLLCK